MRYVHHKLRPWEMVLLAALAVPIIIKGSTKNIRDVELHARTTPTEVVFTWSFTDEGFNATGKTVRIYRRVVGETEWHFLCDGMASDLTTIWVGFAPDRSYEYKLVCPEDPNASYELTAEG